MRYMLIQEKSFFIYESAYNLKLMDIGETSCTIYVNYFNGELMVYTTLNGQYHHMTMTFIYRFIYLLIFRAVRSSICFFTVLFPWSVKENILKEREVIRGNDISYIMQNVQNMWMWMCFMPGRVGEGRISSMAGREAAYYITLWCHSVWCYPWSQIKLQILQNVEASMLNLLPQLSLGILGPVCDSQLQELQMGPIMHYSLQVSHVSVPWAFANDPLCAFNIHSARFGWKWTQSALLIKELILSVCIKSTVSTIFPVHFYIDYLE